MREAKAGLGNWVEIRFCSQVAGRYSAGMVRMYEGEVGLWIEERLAHSKAPLLITEIHVLNISLDKLLAEKIEKSHH